MTRQIAQLTPSQYFLRRGGGSAEMSFAALSDIGADDPVPHHRFYIHNRAATPPEIDPATWVLPIGGDAVGTPAKLTLDDLKTKFPAVALDAVLDCGANARAFFPKLPADDVQKWMPVGFTPWTWGAMGAAQWKGALLSDVLAYANVNTNGTYISFTSLDMIVQGSGETLPYQHNMPMSEALAQNAMLVYEMNGEPLPVDHGFPVRVLIPGYGGNTAVKWLGSIAVTTTAPQNWPLQSNQMLIGPDYPQPVAPTTTNPKSALEMAIPATITLSSEQTSATIYGRAWSSNSTITKVEIRIEQETAQGVWSELVPWTDATMMNTPKAHWWVRFSYVWNDITAGSYRVTTRATDASGAVQDAAVPWNQHGLHWNGHAPHAVLVLPMSNMP
jgi:DMSO/TMAO reductase YedYZ molybdopterin-dependent catalytic subunit